MNLWQSNSYSLFRIGEDTDAILDEPSTDLANEITVISISIYFSLDRHPFAGVPTALQDLLRRACTQYSIHAIVSDLTSAVVNAVVSSNENERNSLVKKTSPMLRHIEHFITASTAALILIQNFSSSSQRSVHGTRMTVESVHFDPLQALLSSFLIQSQEAAVALRQNIPIFTTVSHELADSAIHTEMSLIQTTITGMIDLLYLLQSTNAEFLLKAERCGELAQTNPWTSLLRLVEPSKVYQGGTVDSVKSRMRQVVEVVIASV